MPMYACRWTDGDITFVFARTKEAAIKRVQKSCVPSEERFDITRKAGHHVAFSYGNHQCLGQPLARLELQTVFGSLFERIPTLRFAIAQEAIEGKGDHFVQGLQTLPVRW